VGSSSTDTKGIRKFGFIALIFFGCLFSIGLWAERVVATYVFGALGLLGLGLVVLPERLRPVYAVWMKVAHFIGTMVNTLILTIAYYVVITPSALIKRVLGGAPIPTRPDKSASSYWIARSEPAQPKERFLKRF
jgi:Saxitoxin biosynthesis operon protein SxtJ